LDGQLDMFGVGGQAGQDLPFLGVQLEWVLGADTKGGFRGGNIIGEY